jgi:two-component system, NtrC family, response regulator AtoC
VQLGQEAALVADAAMLRVYALAERLAQSDLPVLVHGETGSGKELLAIAIHHFSEARRARRLVSLNCAALAETLIESELFGHERGAFTGASASRVGLLEAANGGTVFLDEVAELTPSTQAKLLRALDARRIMRLGDTVERPIDVRIVAATHRDLSKEVAAGRFRSDLYFRLSGATLWVSPLRDRPRELVLFAQRFLEEACRRAGRSPMRMSDDAIRALVAHTWPGNVRELRYVIDYLVAAHDDAVLDAWHLEERLGKPVTQAPEAPVPACSPSGFRAIEDEVRELESARMREALATTSGNQRRAAQLISMPLRTFVTKLARYGIKV